MVTMFSGCRDDQTSADANIGAMSEGFMSWAFLETMRKYPNPTYLEVSFSSLGREDTQVEGSRLVDESRELTPE
jgi:Caspase domain